MDKARQQRLEALLDLVLPCRAIRCRHRVIAIEAIARDGAAVELICDVPVLQ